MLKHVYRQGVAAKLKISNKIRIEHKMGKGHHAATTNSEIAHVIGINKKHTLAD